MSDAKKREESMKKVLLVFFVGFVAIMFGGCPLGGTSSVVPGEIVIHNPKALFVAISLEGRSIRAAGGNHGVFEILNDGTVSQVKFYDAANNEISVDVSKLIQINDTYLGIMLTSGFNGIADLRDGTIYDFSGFNLDWVQMWNGYLYIVTQNGPFTLYRVDFNTKTAVAMNNPAFDPLYPSITDLHKFLVVNDGNVITSVDRHGSYPDYLFYFDNTPPKTIVFDAGVGGGYSGGILYDKLGYLYQIEVVNSSNPGWNGVVITKYTADGSGFTRSVASSHQYTPSYTNNRGFNYHCYSLYSSKTYVLYTDGYFKITKNSVQGFDCAWVAKTFPSTIGNQPMGDDVKISLGVVYWKEGDTLRCMDIENDVSPHDIITHSNIINWWIAGNKVLFTAYITGTSIGTYKVDAGGAVLIDSSDMGVKNIVELSL